MNPERDPNRPASRRHLEPVGSAARTAPPFLEYEDGDAFARRQLDLFTDLIRAVGSAEALWELNVDPLPEEPLDESAFDPADLPFVTQVVAQLEAVTTIVFDVEHRTIARRILARIARRDPSALRRRPDVDRCAAALMWLVLHANAAIRRRGRLSAQFVWSWFEVGDCSGRGRTLRRAAGLDADGDDPTPPWQPLPLGDPTLLDSRYRAGLVRERDMLLDIARRRRTFSIERTDGRVAHVRVNAQEAKVAAATKGILGDGGRAAVFVGFGDDPEQATYFSLTIPEAHELIHMVQRALDGPLPASGWS